MNGLGIGLTLSCLALVIAGAPAAFAKSPAGLVSVSKRFEDREEGYLPATSVGSGMFIGVTAPGEERIQKLFLLTACHVAPDGKIEIGISGNASVPVIGGRIDCEKDLTLLEVPADAAAPLGLWNSSDRRIKLYHQLAREWLGAKFPRVDSKNGLAFNVGHEGSGRAVLKGDWVSSAPVVLVQRGVDPHPIRRIPMTGQSYLPTMQVARGMSGGPLIQPVINPPGPGGGSYSFVVSGLISRYNRHFSGSYLVSEEEIARHIESYLAQPVSGEVLYANDARYVLERGVSHFDFGNGTKEIAVKTIPAGTLTRGDGSQGQSNGPAMKPEILWKDAPTLGFRFGSTALAGDVDSIRLAMQSEKFSDCGGIAPLGEDFDFVSAFKERLGTSTRNLNMPNLLQSPRLSVISDTRRSPSHMQPVQQIEVFPDRIEIRIDTLDGEKVGLLIDRKGNWESFYGERRREKYIPVVGLDGSRGGKYVIDLSSLFFVWLSSLQSIEYMPATRLPGGAPEWTCASLSALAAKEPPSVLFRSAKETQTSRLEFTWISRKAPCPDMRDGGVNAGNLEGLHEAVGGALEKLSPI